MTCFFCTRQEIKPEVWQLDSLKFIYQDFQDRGVPKLCQAHEEWIKSRIQELEKSMPKKVVLKTGEPTRFMPTPAVEPKSRYEREPGEDG